MANGIPRYTTVEMTGYSIDGERRSRSESLQVLVLDHGLNDRVVAQYDTKNDGITRPVCRSRAAADAERLNAAEDAETIA